jgi:hypothetical protein
MNPTYAFAAASLLASLPAQTLVFQDDFEGSMPAQIAPGTAFLTGVQGYAGYGPAGNTFAGSFLRSPTGNEVTLTLNGLPAHNAISLDFLFAAIDSLDGTGSFPGGDFFRVSVDGNPIFRESFANALPSQIQSYVPPAGVQLARRIDLGFGGPGSYYTDSAYWLGGDALFMNIGHTGATLTVTFVIEGAGIQPLSDESWAIDNLRVSIDTVTNPGYALAYGTSCGPVLAATVAPRVGRQLPLLVTNMPSTSLMAGCAFGLSNTNYNGMPLPMSLTSLGMPGCWLLQDLHIGDAVRLQMFGSTSAAIWIPVPNETRYAGMRAYFQVWAISPGANATGAVFSNGLDVQIGG